MRNALPILLLSSTLTACGGGSGSSETTVPQPSTPPANEAPTMSGVFTLNAKATQSSKVVLTAEDKEGDTLTFSITNKPDWISFQQNNNQIEVDFQPGFFDIKDHKFGFTISDGKDSTSYDFNLTVEDNRDRWQKISMNEASITGAWSNKDENMTFVFLKDQTGIYTSNAEVKPFTWLTPKNVDMYIFEAGCFQGDCVETDFLEMSVVAQESNQIRVSIVNNNDQETVINLKKDATKTISGGRYMSPLNGDFSKITEVNIENSSVTLHHRIADFALGRSTYLDKSLVANGNLHFDGTEYSITSTTPILLDDEFTASFYNMIDGRSDRLSFQLIANKITLRQLDTDKLISQIDFRIELLTDLTDLEINNYEDLVEALASERTTITFHELLSPLENIPQLEVGKTYTGKLLENREINIEGVEYISGGSVFTLTGANQGEMVLKVAGLNKFVTLPFTWQQQGDYLEIIADGKTTKHFFIRYPDGSVGLTTDFTTSQDTLDVNVSLFQEIKAASYTINDYIGSFRYIANNPMYSRIRHLLIDQSGAGDISFRPFEVGFDDFWKQETDGSLSLISNRNCLNYDDCLAQQMFAVEQQTLSQIIVRNIKLISVEENKYTFQYSYWRQSSDGDNIALQRLTTFNKESN